MHTRSHTLNTITAAAALRRLLLPTRARRLPATALRLLHTHTPLHFSPMSTPSVAAFFKPTGSPKKATEAAAAAASAPKETAASRKRKSTQPAAAADGSAAAQSGEQKDDAAAAAAGDVGADAAPAAKRSKGESLASLVPPSWAKALAAEIDKPYFGEIEKFLRQQENAGTKVFPKREHIFRALDLCPLDKTRVVILGQDPYHDDGQAEGMCFSVPEGVKVPSSLQNIYKELVSDLGPSNFTKPKHGHLVKWAEQGILMLNTGLTVKAHEANSHKKVGWQKFTEAIIRTINKERKGVVFILWGAHAQAAAKGVDQSKHHILKSAHPSGLSASRGFFGCKHFSKCNELLVKEGGKPIDWQV